MREAMGRDAVAAALAVGYRGAGHGRVHRRRRLKHYFLEMNTRLQVEHPVTEMVTGLDLVEWQLRVAAGEPLPLQQDEVRLHGHAIEARLYAEDPYSRPTLRAADRHACAGGGPKRRRRSRACASTTASPQAAMVSPFYDAMVAKLIVHGRDRDDAIRRLRAALHDAPLLGLRNNGRFLADLLDHPAFRGAAMTTTLIDEWFEQGEPIAAAAAAARRGLVRRRRRLRHCDGAGWRADSVAAYDIDLQLRRRDARLRVRARPRRHACRSTHRRRRRTRCGVLRVRRTASCATASTACSGARWRCAHGSELHLALDGASFVFSEPSALRDRGRRASIARPRAVRRWPASCAQVLGAAGRRGGRAASRSSASRR